MSSGLVPLDAQLYELWSEGYNPWDEGELSSFSASVLSYGPEGCGKSFLLETLREISGRKTVALDIAAVLSNPDRVLERTLQAARAARGGLLAIDRADDLIAALRTSPGAYHRLLNEIRSPTSGLAVFAMARQPWLLRAEEVEAFRYVLPVFYGNVSRREVTIVIAAGHTVIGPDVDLRELARLTEWWSPRELVSLMAETPTGPGGYLTQGVLLQRIAQLESNIVPAQRRNRTQQLYAFTARHCTSRYIRDDLAARFGIDLAVPEHVPESPNISVVIESIAVGELKVTQEIKQAGVVIQPGASASGVTVNQTYNEANLDLEALARQLPALIEALQREPASQERDNAVTALAAARRESSAGDPNKVLQFLKGAGKYAFEAATKIGQDVAAAAIKAALNLP